MSSTSKEFRRTICQILIIGFVIVGVLQLQVIEHEYECRKVKLLSAKRSGEQIRETEAIRLGLGRYENENFIWNTNVFNSMEMAISSVLESEKRTKEVAQACIDMARITVVAGDFIKNMNINTNTNLSKEISYDEEE